MLLNLDPVLTGQLLMALDEMGHGDGVVIADAHFTASKLAKKQNPVGIGEQVVAAAVKTLHGETVPKVIDTGYYWYDKTNINDAKIQAVLYK